jgi:uncharacterized protein
VDALLTLSPTLVVAAFVAGLIDAIIGGGGLIQLPALMATYPNAAPPWWLGTNKFASIFGTASAAARYSARLALPRAWLIPAASVAFAGAFLGSVLITLTNAAIFKLLAPILLTAVLLYTLLQKKLGFDHTPIERRGRWALLGFIGCGCIGFYDGFFGPGTGSLLMLWMIRYYGYDFLNAASSARVINTFTNAASLLWFGAHGQVGFALGAALAAANVLGALTGTRLAFYGGVRFIRIAFMIIVSDLILKTAWQSAVGLGWVR